MCEITIPLVVQKYNKYMGGVDKSDQYLLYQNVLRKTVRYCKTLFYHMVDIAAVDAFILYNYTASLRGIRAITENDFRDQVVLQMISLYGKNRREKVSLGRHPQARIKHGSFVFPIEQRSCCQYCYMKGVISWTQRKCKDCDFQPALCQVQGRDCHMNWHKSSFDEKRNGWFQNHQKSDLPQEPMTTYYTKSQATRQREQVEEHKEQDVVHGEQDDCETHKEQDVVHGEQDDCETHEEQDVIHGEQDNCETHEEQDVVHGEQDDCEKHEEQDVAHGEKDDILLLRPHNRATTHRGRSKGSINKKR